MKGYTVYLWMLYGLFLSGTTLAQSTDTLQANSISDRVGINSFRFTNQIAGRRHFGPQFYVFGRAGSDWLFNQRLTGNQFVTRDFFSQAGFGWELNNDWAIESLVDVYDYATYETRIAHAGGRIRWTPASIFPAQFTLFTGVRLDKRIQFTDYGPSLVVMGSSRPQSRQDSVFHWSVVAENHWIKPRKISLIGGAASYRKQFNDDAGIVAGFGYYRRRMDDYSSQNIQRISSDTLLTSLQMMFSLSPRLKVNNYTEFGIPIRDFRFLNIQTGQTNRNVGYNQVDLLNRSEITYQAEKLTGLGRFEYRQRDRTYYLKNLADPKSVDFQVQLREHERQLELEKTKDIQEQSFGWFYEAKWLSSQTSFLQFSSVAQLFRVNTPSNRNDQDRDEVYYSGTLAYENQLFDQFRFTMKTSGSYRHFIFIKPSQSIENFKDRVLRIDPGFSWKIGKLTWDGSQTLWVTYQVRDFVSEMDRNRSNRIFLSEHRLKHPMNRNSDVEFLWLYRENRLSRLDWERFKESPIDTNIVNDLKLLFRKQKLNAEGKGKWVWEVGWRHFSQVRKSQSGFNENASGIKLIYLRNILWQTGPTGQVSWQTTQRFSCSLYLWFQQNLGYNRYKSSDKEYIGPVSTRESLQQKENRNIPYFTIQLSYIPGAKQ